MFQVECVGVKQYCNTNVFNKKIQFEQECLLRQNFTRSMIIICSSQHRLLACEVLIEKHVWAGWAVALWEAVPGLLPTSPWLPPHASFTDLYSIRSATFFIKPVLWLGLFTHINGDNNVSLTWTYVLLPEVTDDANEVSASLEQLQLHLSATVTSMQGVRKRWCLYSVGFSPYNCNWFCTSIGILENSQWPNQLP